MAKSYGVSIVMGTRIHQMKQYIISGSKVVVPREVRGPLLWQLRQLGQLRPLSHANLKRIRLPAEIASQAFASEFEAAAYLNIKLK